MFKKFPITPTFVLAAVACISSTGCVSPKPEQRYLGYQETITQGNRNLYGTSSLSHQDKVKEKAAVQRLGKVSETMTINVNLQDYRTAIARREQMSGSFELNFGGNADVVFSIQPCAHIVAEDNFLVCGDQNAAAPLTVSQTIRLTGGQQVSSKFANDIVWTYRVLDQSSPLFD